jgi:hypothetical protein
METDLGLWWRRQRIEQRAGVDCDQAMEWWFDGLLD